MSLFSLAPKLFYITCSIGIAIAPSTVAQVAQTIKSSSQSPATNLSVGSSTRDPHTALLGGSDNCATPEAIAGCGPFAFNNTAATTGTDGQANAICLIGAQIGITNDVWFTWTSSFTGPATLSLCGGTTMDSKVAVYAGNGCPAPGAAIACDDDYCGPQSRLCFATTSGSVYMIQLGNSPGAAPGAGTFTICNCTCASGTTYADPAAFFSVVGNGNPIATADNLVGMPPALCEQICTQYTGIDFGGTARAWNPGANGGGGCAVSQPNSILNYGADPIVMNFSPAISAVGLYNPSEGDDVQVTVYGACNAMLAQCVLPHMTCPAASFLGFVSDEPIFRVEALGVQFTNGTIFIDSVTYRPLVTPPNFSPFCIGTNCPGVCPCLGGLNGNGKNGAGCDNSADTGGLLLCGSGTAFADGTDSVDFMATQGLPHGAAMLVQTTGQSAGAVYRDGRLCLAGTLVRFQVKVTVAGAVAWGPGAGDAPIHIHGAIPPTIQTTRYYQVYYRDPSNYCLSAYSNISNGVIVNWN